MSKSAIGGECDYCVCINISAWQSCMAIWNLLQLQKLRVGTYTHNSSSNSTVRIHTTDAATLKNT